MILCGKKLINTAANDGNSLKEKIDKRNNDQAEKLLSYLET